MTGWWRANRLWLAALPVVAAGTAAAASYNVVDNWYRAGLHHELAHADSGEWVSVREEYDDRLGATTRSYEVRLVDLEEVDEWPYYDDAEPGPPPEGLKAVQARLEWKADPDQVIRGCVLSLVDAEGNRYDTDSGDSTWVCVPEDAGGPEAPLLPTGVRGQAPELEEPRPAEWSTEPVFLVPEDVELTQMLLWWGPPPDYVSLSLP